MGDLKSFWPNPGGETPGLDGDAATSRGSDPSVTVDSPNALDPIWPAPPVAPIDGSESPNSVSGLPSLPNRYEPNVTPPGPPSLQDRRPGTIDER
jgi:hypothetical protein